VSPGAIVVEDEGTESISIMSLIAVGAGRRVYGKLEDALKGDRSIRHTLGLAI
jgi:hypothetical protein